MSSSSVLAAAAQAGDAGDDVRETAEGKDRLRDSKRGRHELSDAES